MTNREAIDILEEVKAVDDSIYAYNPAYTAALDKVIDSVRASSIASYNDTISRQAAICAVNELTYPSSLMDVKIILASLPSAQPERYWVTCFDCPLSHGCPKIKGCTNEQAVEYAGEIPNDCPLSVYPQRIRGHRIKDERGYTRCDQCGSRLSAVKANYCSHCGADMRGNG